MASVRSSLPLFRGLAHRMSKDFFSCRQYRTSSFHRPLSTPKSSYPTASSMLLHVRARQFFSPSWKNQASSAIVDAAEISTPKSGSRFPNTSSKAVAYWLLGSAVSVFGITVFGGLTRLTESGLSITEWRPVAGSLPPMNAEDWESEFSKYRASPEFQVLNPNMTLSEFKSIYYMEWIHRVWGRFIGLTFILPGAYFVAAKKVSKPIAWRLGGIAALIAFQGFVGWWMVESGLRNDIFSSGNPPRVSQYRLTAHLAMAFTCYAAMLWNGLAILRSHRLHADPKAGLAYLEALRDPKLKIFRRSVAGLALLIFTTAMSGALVAGLDAGLIYNEFPMMGTGLTPPKSELFDDKYSRNADRSDRWWRNMLENPSLVQLDHRILAVSTFTGIMALWAYTHRSSSVKKLLPATVLRGLHGVVAFSFVQVGLGISTLLYLVPIPLASAHQAGSLILLTLALTLGSRVWHPTRTAKLLQMAAKSRGQQLSNATRAASKL